MHQEAMDQRFSSCRGVSFEIQPHRDPFAINPPRASRRNWLPWGSSSKIVPSSTAVISRSTSRASSHFCDVETDDEDDEENVLINIEEGYELDDKYEFPLPDSIPEVIPRAPSEKIVSKPKKPNKDTRLSVILLDQGLFTVYKRLFMVCLALNVTGLVLAATGRFPYARNRATLFSIGNLMALTLCRSEAFLRVVFWLAVSLFGHSWVPLRIKTATTALLQSLGGIHSGCGVSSVAWLTYSLVLTLKDREETSNAIIGVASAILSLLSLCCLAAFPLVRHLHHNVFERTHRFAGGCRWFSFGCLSCSRKPTNPRRNLTRKTWDRAQEFWLTLATTMLIIIPWVTVRRVAVKVSAPSVRGRSETRDSRSDKSVPDVRMACLRDHFRWEGRAHDAGGCGGRLHEIARLGPAHPLMGKASPFRGPALSGQHVRPRLGGGDRFGHLRLFVVLASTRSGGRVLVVGGERHQRELWERNKGVGERHPNEKVIVHDTAVMGRPNVAEMSIAAAKKWGAEVVIVTSNPEGSRDVVNACKSKGIPAFGPIWDS
ncbi:hypothetical protein OSB04_001975 [Centaurea solstitialis]|uniref:Uncharacterized protein n=1 Tax=Centaurea solstitialis TaxID=347529 RepID=A0AA38TSE4_9ASTR|nr:hypothetical protein OSB04_001975 [Centaurea solstitialis]